MVTYEIESEITRTRAPCEGSSVPMLIMTGRRCVNGTVVIERVTVTKHVTPLLNGWCHNILTVISEFYDTLRPCVPGQPMDNGQTPTEEWLDVIAGSLMGGSTLAGDTYPQSGVSFPIPVFDPNGTKIVGGCESGAEHTYTRRCIEGLVHITRSTRFTVAMPLPSGECYILRYVVEETVKTNEACDVADDGFVVVSPEELAERWLRAASEDQPEWMKAEPAKTGPRVGTEEKSHSLFRPAVREVHRQEKAAGQPYSGPPRPVYVRAINGLKPTHATVLGLTPGSTAKFSIGVGYSKHTGAVVLQVVEGSFG